MGKMWRSPSPVQNVTESSETRPSSPDMSMIVLTEITEIQYNIYVIDNIYYYVSSRLYYVLLITFLNAKNLSIKEQ